MEKTEFMGAQHGPRLAVPGAAGRGEGKVRAALTVPGPRRWEEGVHGPGRGEPGARAAVREGRAGAEGCRKQDWGGFVRTL